MKTQKLFQLIEYLFILSVVVLGIIAFIKQTEFYLYMTIATYNLSLCVSGIERFLNKRRIIDIITIAAGGLLFIIFVSMMLS